MGLREALSNYASAALNYLLGRDMDAVPVRGPDPVLARTGRAAPGRPGPPLLHVEQARLAEAVEQARLEWLAARNYFDQVVEPDLIDYAVLSIGAAEKRYMLLLARARQADVKVDPLRPATARPGIESRPRA